MAADRSWLLSGHQARALAGDPHTTHQWYTGVSTPRDRDADVDVLTATYTGRYPPVTLQDALISRDGTCQARGCTIPAEGCDLDHRQPWGTGGATGQGICRHYAGGTTDSNPTSS